MIVGIIHIDRDVILYTDCLRNNNTSHCMHATVCDFQQLFIFVTVTYNSTISL